MDTQHPSSPRIALLVAGQMRSVEDPDVRASLRRFLADSFGAGVQVDVFVSTWSIHGTSHNHGHPVDRGFATNTVTAQKLLTWFEDSQGPIAMTLRSHEIHDLAAWEATLSPTYRQVYTEGFQWRGMSIKGTVVPQLFTLWDANRLRTHYERQTGVRYTCVMRVRPDVMFRSPLNPVDWTPEALQQCIYAINCANAWHPQRIYDIFFYGGPTAMTCLCDAYNHLEALVAHPFQNGLHPRDCCRILYVQAAEVHGLVVRDLPYNVCEIRR